MKYGEGVLEQWSSNLNTMVGARELPMTRQRLVTDNAMTGEEMDCVVDVTGGVPVNGARNGGGDNGIETDVDLQ